MSNGITPSSSMSALAVIENLANRFERTERQIDEDIAQIQRRMEQLVELIRAVSSIQHQVGTQQKALGDLRNEVREQLSALEALVVSSDTKYISNIETLTQRVSAGMSEQTRARAVLSERITDVDNRIKMWVNRAIGVYGMLSLVFGVFQYIGFQYVDSLKVERDSAYETIERMRGRIDDLELRQRTLEKKHEYSAKRERSES